MPGTRDRIFDRLVVDHMIRGFSRVSWGLLEAFRDPSPHTFQLQAGRAGINAADDWVDVGLPVTDGNFATDDEQRLYGKSLVTHYRVVLETLYGTYTSPPAPVWGELDKRNWCIARDIVRRERLRYRLGAFGGAFIGQLLKRKRYGERCTACCDPMTGEVMDSDCEVCHGTGVTGGYYPPVNMEMDLPPETENLRRDESRGTVRDTGVEARTLGFPKLDKMDIWVDPRSDQRWVVDSVKTVAAIRGVPLVVAPMLLLAAYTDEAYRLALE